MPSYNSNRRDLPMKEKEKKKSVSRARALLSKENKGVEAGETSFRVYYGEIGAAVPFMWESQPGTPKHPNFKRSNDDIVPPLTPPPSYNSSSSSATSSGTTRKMRILSVFISSISRKSRSLVTPTPSLSFSSHSGPLSWSRSSSSSSSISLTSPHHSNERIRYKAQRRNTLLCSTRRTKKFSPLDDDELEIVDDSPTTSVIGCFGFKKQGCNFFY